MNIFNKRTTSLTTYILALFFLTFHVSCFNDEPEPQDTQAIDEAEGLVIPIELILTGQEACGLNAIDSVDKTHVKYSFDGSKCYEDVYKWYGNIEIFLINGRSWSDEGAVIGVKYIDFKTVRKNKRSDKKIASSTLMNGTEQITNITGGDISAFMDGKVSFLQRRYVAKGLSVIYNDSDRPREINTIIQRDFINDGVLKIISTGLGSVDAYENVIEWGIDSRGREFWNVVEEPIVKTLCNKRWLITDGVKVKHSKNRASRSNYYGVDEVGIETNDCDSFGYRVSWTSTGGTPVTKIYAYYVNQ